MTIVTGGRTASSRVWRYDQFPRRMTVLGFRSGMPDVANSHADACGRNRPRLNQTVRGGLLRPPGTIPSTCSSLAAGMETIRLNGERILGPALVWKAWQRVILQQPEPVASWWPAFWSPQDTVAPCPHEASTASWRWWESNVTACSWLPTSAAFGMEIGKIAMVIASSTAMIGAIRRKNAPQGQGLICVT